MSWPIVILLAIGSIGTHLLAYSYGRKHGLAVVDRVLEDIRRSSERRGGAA